jgi:hypothetical protein
LTLVPSDDDVDHVDESRCRSSELAPTGTRRVVRSSSSSDVDLDEVHCEEVPAAGPRRHRAPQPSGPAAAAAAGAKPLAFAARAAGLNSESAAATKAPKQAAHSARAPAPHQPRLVDQGLLDYSLAHQGRFIEFTARRQSAVFECAQKHRFSLSKVQIQKGIWCPKCRKTALEFDMEAKRARLAREQAHLFAEAAKRMRREQQTVAGPDIAAADPFRCLGLPPNSSFNLVQARFRELALQYHPDKHSTAGLSKAAATEKFCVFRCAFEKIRDRMGQ